MPYSTLVHHANPGLTIRHFRDRLPFPIEGAGVERHGSRQAARGHRIDYNKSTWREALMIRERREGEWRCTDRVPRAESNADTTAALLKNERYIAENSL